MHQSVSHRTKKQLQQQHSDAISTVVAEKNQLLQEQRDAISVEVSEKTGAQETVVVLQVMLVCCDRVSLSGGVMLLFRIMY